MPSKWIKHLHTREISNNLGSMFRDCHDIQIHGDPIAYQKYQDWKDEEVISKRNKKEIFKTQQMKLSEAE